MRYSVSAQLLHTVTIAAACAALVACGGGKLARDEAPTAKPASKVNEPVVRRRAQLKFFRRQKAEDAPTAPAPSPPPPPPAPKPPKAISAPKPEIVSRPAPPPPEPSPPKAAQPQAAPPVAPLPPAAESDRPRTEPKIARPKPFGAGQVITVAPAEARRRVAAYLMAKGYSFQGEDQTTGPLLTDPMLSGPQSIEHLAACGGGALAHPILHSIEIEVGFAPEGAGTRVIVGTLFTEVRQAKMGKGMSKTDCKSRGVLEADILRIAAGN